ncbi:nucleotide sugar dehydrogenase [Carnobacterium maltaromaticum]|uniref:nucleotide sugar dehydrogenase n=1 Tax=Carnobacterium maltaromaticum TaxID=2751 RepID=UPI00191B992D|nr:nucleotide sugar dehydrogenase [Carnobacterium maltaromaticum]CAD5896163.1 UDP-glucose 6-dehydrogenase [Carnobacterium maltaromaticum]
MKISVVGLGYVGLSNALLLARNNEVTAYDISAEKIKQLQNGKTPILEKEIIDFMNNLKLTIEYTCDEKYLSDLGELVILAVPTNYDEDTRNFDTSILEEMIQKIMKVNFTGMVIIKSTVPIGFTKKMRLLYKTNQIIFCPEFLREGKSLFDNLHPSRIIIGDESNSGKLIGQLFLDAATEKKIPLLYMSATEAESVKLFSNTYLAMRIAYFNELDTYCAIEELNTKKIIEGMSHDERIGSKYNNPSFGYGGYCLPKDSKQLVHTLKGVPNQLISSIPTSNEVRKNFIVSEVLKEKPKVIGIYKLSMKKNSDNFRQASILDIITELKQKKMKVIIYEPGLDDVEYAGVEIRKNLASFKDECNLILANRMDNELKSVEENVYTRDIFGKDL